MPKALLRKYYPLPGVILLGVLALAGCTQPTSVPSGAPPTPIVLRTPPPTITPIPPAPAPSPAPPATLSVYAALSDHSLAALDANSGKLRWRIPSLEPILSLTLVNDILYLGTDVGVYALNASDGTIRWHRYQAGTSIIGLAVQNNVVYAVSEGGGIQALNASDGNLRWGQLVGFPLNSLVLDRGRLFVGSAFGALEGWDLNGNLLWIQEVSGVSFSRLVAHNGIIYVAENPPNGGTSPPHLAAFSLDGQPLWDITPGQGGPLTAPVVTADGLIYTADAVGLYAIDPFKGTTRWQMPTSRAAPSAPSGLATSGNTVIVCTRTSLPNGQVQEQVLAFSQGEGKPYWQTTLEAGQVVSSSSCQALGNIFLVEALGRLYALNGTSGALLWNSPPDLNVLPVFTAG